MGGRTTKKLGLGIPAYQSPEQPKRRLLPVVRSVHTLCAEDAKHSLLVPIFFRNNASELLREKVIPLEEDTVIDRGDWFSRYGRKKGFKDSCMVYSKLFEQGRSEAYLGAFYAHRGAIINAAAERCIQAVTNPPYFVEKEIRGVLCW